MRSSFVIWLLSAFCISAFAETQEKTATIAGTTVHYKVILPRTYDASRAYPAVLAFAGGSQTMPMVDGMLARNWGLEAQRRGYIIVSPAAPGNDLFYQKGDRIFPEFLDQILRDYKVQDGKLHIAGFSSGGLSAFHIAAKYPQYFKSVTGYPGYLADETPLDALSPLCIYMHAGELDSSWIGAMRQQSDALRRRGFHVRMTVEKGQQHMIQTLAGDGAKRLYDQLEEAMKGCN